MATEPILALDQKFEGGGWVRVFRGVFSGTATIKEHLWGLRPKDPQWVRMFGRWMRIPRRQLAMGRDYTFSGQTATAAVWDGEVHKILEYVREVLRVDVNGCLMNFYDGPQDYIGFCTPCFVICLAGHIVGCAWGVKAFLVT